MLGGEVMDAERRLASFLDYVLRTNCCTHKVFAVVLAANASHSGSALGRLYRAILMSLTRKRGLANARLGGCMKRSMLENMFYWLFWV